MDWLSLQINNKPQPRALLGSSILMIVSGLHLGWGLFNANFLSEKNISELFGMTEVTFWMVWLVISWFAAACFGFYVGAKLVESLRKIKIYLICYGISAISAILFILFKNWAPLLLVGRIFAGFSHGIAYITTIIHAGEIANPKLRGMIVGLGHLSLMLGVLISTSMNWESQENEHFSGYSNFNLYLGITSLSLLVIGAAVSYFFVIESPVFYIRKQQSQKAQDLIMKLRNEDELTDDTRKDFEDLQLMVTEDIRDGDNVFDRKNLKTLNLVIVLQVAFACSFNIYINSIWMAAAAGRSTINQLALVRFFTVLFMIFIFDFARRTFATISTFFMSLITLTLLISNYFDSMSSNNDLMIALGFLAQFFGSIGVAIHADVYSTECFSLLKKSMSIAHLTTVEFAVQILLIFYHFYSVMRPIWVQTILFGWLLGTSIVIFRFPDTAYDSLSAAKVKFHSL